MRDVHRNGMFVPRIIIIETGKTRVYPNFPAERLPPAVFSPRAGEFCRAFFFRLFSLFSRQTHCILIATVPVCYSLFSFLVLAPSSVDSGGYPHCWNHVINYRHSFFSCSVYFFHTPPQSDTTARPLFLYFLPVPLESHLCLPLPHIW